jgi:hypothetical protein
MIYKINMKLFALLLLTLTSYGQQSSSLLDYSVAGILDREFVGCGITWSVQVTSKR